MPLPIKNHFTQNLFIITISFVSFFLLAEPQISNQDFLPFSYPLAVRSPYFNSWQNTPRTATSLTQDWPKHWSGQINGWSGFVRVDGITWKWLGNSPIGNATTLLDTEITPTRTKFTVAAGNVTLIIEFLSPIETDDLTKQSIPFSYLTFECQSKDGTPHKVEVYSDISAEWISGNRFDEAVWSTIVTNSSVIHSAWRQSQQSMTENGNIAEDAKVYYAMEIRNGLSYQSGTDNDVRGTFRDQGKLLNTSDTNFRPINKNFIVFGISVSLGTIISTPEPIIWGIGLVRDPITNYSSAGTSYRPYFLSDPQFVDKQIEDVIDSFLQDYDSAAQRADKLDEQISTDASAALDGDSRQYYNLLAISARQAIAVDFTFANVENMTDIKAFMRNTGFDASVNNVGTLYSSFSAFLYLNTTWSRYLLDSLLQFQDSSSYTNPYAAGDLGSTYPKAPGDGGDASLFGVEDTASMLIMVLAHAKMSGDGSLISKYYSLLKSWADYLVQNALNSEPQLSSDDIKPTVLDTSKLAMRAIIGIGAMAQISRACGVGEDEMSYSADASNFALQWKHLALGSDAITATFGDTDSYALMYDLYSDLLLGTELFDQDVYDTQNAMVKQVSGGPFGIPLDSNINTGNITASTWMMFVAASLSRTDNATRSQIINKVFARAALRDLDFGGNFPVSYDVYTGEMIDSQKSGQASPAQGAMFSLLALNIPSQTIKIPDSFQRPSSHSSGRHRLSKGAIAGTIIGGLAGLIILVTTTLFLVRKWRKKSNQRRRLDSSFSQRVNTSATPFWAGIRDSRMGQFDPYNSYN